MSFIKSSSSVGEAYKLKNTSFFLMSSKAALTLNFSKPFLVSLCSFFPLCQDLRRFLRANLMTKHQDRLDIFDLRTTMNGA